MNDENDLKHLRDRDIERQEPQGTDYIKMLLLWLVPGTRSVKVLISAALAFAASAGLFMAALWLLASSIPHIFLAAVITGGAGLTGFCMGVCWLLDGAVVTPAQALANFDEVHWLIIITLALAYLSGFGAAVGHTLKAQAQNPPAQESEGQNSP